MKAMGSASVVRRSRYPLAILEKWWCIGGATLLGFAFFVTCRYISITRSEVDRRSSRKEDQVVGAARSTDTLYLIMFCNKMHPFETQGPQARKGLGVGANEVPPLPDWLPGSWQIIPSRCCQ